MGIFSQPDIFDYCLTNEFVHICINIPTARCLKNTSKKSFKTASLQVKDSVVFLCVPEGNLLFAHGSSSSGESLLLTSSLQLLQPTAASLRNESGPISVTQNDVKSTVSNLNLKTICVHKDPILGCHLFCWKSEANKDVSERRCASKLSKLR